MVDTPPGLGPIVQAVLSASDRVIVPLQCEPLALQTTSQILKGIRDAISRHGNLRLEGIVLTLYEDESDICRKIAARVREQLPAQLVACVNPLSPVQTTTATARHQHKSATTSHGLRRDKL